MVDKFDLFKNIYEGKTVLITGHTGFKGSWLALWLNALGAQVHGISLPQKVSNPNHFDLLNVDIHSHYLDIRNHKALVRTVEAIQPTIVFHLGAQALVIDSYKKPIETYHTNVLGTLHLFEACRKTSSVEAIVNITSDKVYENKEWTWGYREQDMLGGYDMYSSSKACSEILTSSYRRSFLEKEDKILLASVRAGNVIGGGDWGENRIIPDIFRAIEQEKALKIRSPQATRPWQHVLEPLTGYLKVGEKLLLRQKKYADAWNFGPESTHEKSVLDLVKAIQQYSPLQYEIPKIPNKLHEAHFLKIDSNKSKFHLDWKPVWNFETTIAITCNWYNDFLTKQESIFMTERSLADIRVFCEYFMQKEVAHTQYKMNLA